MLLNSFILNEKLSLKNRIIMAPMTRNFATDQFVPTQDMADYYARRADTGLIITEGTIISKQSIGYSNQPGIYTSQQIRAWQQVTKQVHANGGKIFCQIWHVGRVSHPHFLQGELPVGPSQTIMTGRVNRSQGLFYDKNRALEIDEIKQIVNDFSQAATNALEAGFDGVEIHGANGYLIDQFLHHSTNLRHDEYGLNGENKIRFATEVVNACGNAIGYERVALRLSPAGYLNEIKEDKRDAAIFTELLTQLNTLPIAYVHTGNFDDSTPYLSLNNQRMSQFIRQHYKGTLVASGSYDIAAAELGIQNGNFDCIAIGRRFIANPDLINKLLNNKPLKEYDVAMLNELY